MSSIGQVSQDPADLLCAAYDGIPAMTFRTSVGRWDRDPDLERLAAAAASAAVEGDAAALARAAEHESPAARYALVRGLDRALAHANPLLAGVAPPALAPVALRYARTGRLDTGAAGGALLPRFASGGRRGQLPDALQDALGSVVRVPAAAWAACDHVTLPARSRLSRSDREGGLGVGATPLIADPRELRWDLLERDGVRFYRVAPADHAATLARVRRVVAGFDAAGVTVGVAPELCLSPAVLAAWHEALAERPPGASALRLVLAGTGNVERTDPPSNTAVLLDAATGAVLARQRKLFPFNLGEDDLALWGMADRVDGPVDEDLTPGERVAVIEAGGLRLAVLVCEDLARVPALAGPLCAHGISLLLVPVFARPTKDRRWERNRAEAYADASGAAIVVANSLVMARVLAVDGLPGTSIAVGAGTAVVGAAAEAHECAAFRLAGGRPEPLGAGG
jgi:predicted amidohydrolase